MSWTVWDYTSFLTITEPRHLTRLIPCYLSLLGHVILWWNGEKINQEYTLIGEEKAPVQGSHTGQSEV
ncbi:hypothetical protein [Sediminicola arcticus]|uniref:Uncharacterized protein n=1 Tax=Sediminicola arcticus TaxID=1574308 RepID=A0ABV2SS17_9FLAO